MTSDAGHSGLPQNFVHMSKVGRREALSHESGMNSEGPARGQQGGFMFRRYVTMQIKKNLVAEFP